MYVWTPGISEKAVLCFSSCKVILPPTDDGHVCYFQADKASYQLLLSKGQLPHIKSVSSPVIQGLQSHTHKRTTGQTHAISQRDSESEKEV